MDVAAPLVFLDCAYARRVSINIWTPYKASTSFAAHSSTYLGPGWKPRFPRQKLAGGAGGGQKCDCCVLLVAEANETISPVLVQNAALPSSSWSDFEEHLSCRLRRPRRAHSVGEQLIRCCCRFVLLVVLVSSYFC